MSKQNGKWSILRVLTTNKCNYECVYCHNEGQEEKGQNRMVSLEQFIRFYTIALKTGIKEVRFSGGEPLANKATIKMIEWLNSNSDVEVGLATNGSLVTDEIASRLGNTRVMVTLHFPGVGKDKYHAVTKRNWELFENCVQLFDKYNVDYSYNYTLYPGTIDAVDDVVEYSINKGKRVKLLPFLDPGFNNYSTEYVKEIVRKLNDSDSESTYSEEEGVYLWTFNNGAAVKIIESPCYDKDINLCKRYGEIRLLPDLSMMNCIFGKNKSTENKTDEEIFDMFNEMLSEMSACERVTCI